MKTIQPKQWIEFKEKFYKQFPDEDPKILDYIAVYDIIRLAVNGVSNEDIAELLYDKTDYIESVLFEFLGFLGYKESLEFSPLQQYKRIKQFAEQSKGNAFSDICEKYLDIEQKVKEYYDRN